MRAADRNRSIRNSGAVPGPIFVSSLGSEAGAVPGSLPVQNDNDVRYRAIIVVSLASRNAGLGLRLVWTVTDTQTTAFR